MSIKDVQGFTVRHLLFIQNASKYIPTELFIIFGGNVSIAGPASSLFQKSYYELVKNALRPGGISCSQGRQQRSGQEAYHVLKVGNNVLVRRHIMFTR